MAFFEPLPAGEEPRCEPIPVPEWTAPPTDELAVGVGAGAVLWRNPLIALSIRRVDVFSNGVDFRLRIDARRDDHVDDDEWYNILDSFTGSFRHTRRSANRGLRVGVMLPDGDTLAADFHRRISPEQTGGRTLVLRGGGGGGSDVRQSRTYGAWLWPLPPRGDLTLHFMSEEFGIPEGFATFDGGELADAAAGSTPIWR